MTIQERRRLWLAAGLCRDCGGKRDDEQRLRCAKCRTRRNKHGDGRTARRLRREQAGLCGRCGNERDIEFKLCKACRDVLRQNHDRHVTTNKEKVRQTQRNTILRARVDALIAYSGGEPKCACPSCAERNVLFLTIDHINGDGAEQRREKNLTGGQLCAWLRRHNYPPGYRVLCYNCNCARRTGPCPVHEANEIDPKIYELIKTRLSLRLAGAINKMGTGKASIK